MRIVPVLKAENLSVAIGGADILRGINFSVPDGQHLSIVGPNGAGKTTLLKCLMRIHTTWKGRVLLEGRSLATLTQRQLARKMGYVPQADGRHFPFTVEQFVLMSRYPYLSPFSMAGREDHAAVRDALKITEIEFLSRRDIRTLSGGERQKVFIAGALAQGARILLLDEPTTFLDPMHESQILAVLERLRGQSGMTILSVTHDINHAAIYSDRVMALVSGEVVFDGYPGEFMDNRILEKVYEKTFTFTLHPTTGKPLVVPDGRDR